MKERTNKYFCYVTPRIYCTFEEVSHHSRIFVGIQLVSNHSLRPLLKSDATLCRHEGPTTPRGAIMTESTFRRSTRRRWKYIDRSHPRWCEILSQMGIFKEIHRRMYLRVYPFRIMLANLFGHDFMPYCGSALRQYPSALSILRSVIETLRAGYGTRRC